MHAAQRLPVTGPQDDLEALVREPCRVRRFRDEPVPREDIERMVDLATCAVTACDSHVWRFIAVQDRDLIARMQIAVLERFEELALKPGLALQERKRTVARAHALQFAKAPLCMAVSTSPSASLMEELLAESIRAGGLGFSTTRA